jgi:3',5'-cyclic AMP phosphodiesterase CpdA
VRGDEVIILHISDIHRSINHSHDQNRDLIAQLASDITKGFPNDNGSFPTGIPLLPRPEEVDILLVTGDLTQHALEPEFTLAAEFLNQVADYLPSISVNHDRIIVLPGNHDVSWDYSRKAYIEESSITSQMLIDAVASESEYRLSLAAWPPKVFKRGEQKDYEDRLRAFSNFVDAFYKRKLSFPLHPAQDQYMIFDSFSDELGVAVVAFSSCAFNDHLWRRGCIARTAVMDAADELEKRGRPSDKYLRIAAWHHNILGSPDQPDFMDARITRLMANHGFSIGLHGHVHEFQQDVPAFVKREILVMGAGSLSVEPDGRPQGIPLEYNVIGIAPAKKKGWVHIRTRTNIYDSWHSGYQFGPERNKPFLPIHLTEPAQNQRMIFQKSDMPEFAEHIQRLIAGAKSVVMIGTGLNILQKDPMAVDILNKAAAGKLTIEIFLADPYSPAIHTRLIEEELGEKPPPVGRSGLVNNLKSLLEVWRNHGSPQSISINLFGNYPTFALIIVDGWYFLYPYGFARLGNFSPVLTYSKDNPADQDVVDFLDQQYQRIKAHSTNAEDAFISRTNRISDISGLHPFALYFIPPPNSPLYKFGSTVLGYDAYEEKIMDSHWNDWAGLASCYGFHLTICDVLYFLTQAEIASIKAEVEFVLKYFFTPFKLTNLRLRSGFPDEHSISLLVDDPTGSLESLHCEMVHRVYRRATSSNYHCGRDPLNRDDQCDRALFMIRNYHAPYILQKFTPHFTLLSNVAKADLSKVENKLRKLFNHHAADLTVHVDRLSFMDFSKQSNRWNVGKEVAIG